MQDRPDEMKICDKCGAYIKSSLIIRSRYKGPQQMNDILDTLYKAKGEEPPPFQDCHKGRVYTGAPMPDRIGYHRPYVETLCGPVRDMNEQEYFIARLEMEARR